MVTIVMPAYNEAEIIEASVRAWYTEVIGKLPGSELVVVDDCSTDGTGEILKKMSGELPMLRVLRTPSNGGHGAAVSFGLRRAKQDFVFQTDSDGQYPPEEFWNLWNERERSDFVFGERTSRADGLFRMAVSTCLRVINLMVWGIWVRDANCPFKLMRKEALEKVMKHIPADSFIPMVFVSMLARKMRMRVLAVPVTHLPRRGGSQSLQGMLRWYRVGKQCVGEIMRIRKSWQTR